VTEREKWQYEEERKEKKDKRTSLFTDTDRNKGARKTPYLSLKRYDFYPFNPQLKTMNGRQVSSLNQQIWQM
jgi:hypothetical protein